ncbi:hypothetical protein [Arthrobacter sp. SO5]|uniref:8-oxoguanine DNA glycosylase OGG fold protein n=1 Tax=Arthrobacter sp. SO5 TaxID=1897055 RepID=UPI001E534E7C|nr:hypothetical protein [Arthrobacter sp. SO5]
METPKALKDTYNRWQKAGRTKQSPSHWKPQAWARQLPEHASILESLPVRPIGRTDGIELVGDVTTEESAVRAFLLAMIWGYGPVGYGPFRTRRVLESHDAPARLLEIAKIARLQGGLAAFEHIEQRRAKDRGYLKYLGPVFGTKYLYFLTASVTTVAPAPVMDAVVSRWFRKNVDGAPLKVIPWDSRSYGEFLTHLDYWSKSLVGDGSEPLNLADVEYLIFASGASFELRTEWSEEWEKADARASVGDLVDRLRAVFTVAPNIDDAAAQLIDELERALESKLQVEEVD